MAGCDQFKALGTGVVVLTTDPQRIGDASIAVRRVVADIDAACSRFRPDSEIEVANRASGHPVVVGPLLAEAIEVSLQAARLTDGDLDPTVGETMRLIGYDRDFGLIDDGRPLKLTLAPVRGWRHVHFNAKWGILHVPSGIQLDLGATAKALAADRAASAAHEAAGCGVLVSLGGDIATAGPPPPGGWLVKIADWHGAPPDGPGPTVAIESGGLATSSTTVRRWAVTHEETTEEMHHIVEPRTGRPAEVVWRTVTAAASTCVDANVAATTAIVRGERAPAWLLSRRIAARLVRPDGSVVQVAGWPAEAAA